MVQTAQIVKNPGVWITVAGRAGKGGRLARGEASPWRAPGRRDGRALGRKDWRAAVGDDENYVYAITL